MIEIPPETLAIAATVTGHTVGCMCQRCDDARTGSHVMTEPYTDQDVDLVAKAVYDCDYVLVTDDPPWSGLSPFDQDSYRALARYVLDVLTDAGRLTGIKPTGRAALSAPPDTEETTP